MIRAMITTSSRTNELAIRVEGNETTREYDWDDGFIAEGNHLQAFKSYMNEYEPEKDLSEMMLFPAGYRWE
jgi:hypothetical protein